LGLIPFINANGSTVPTVQFVHEPVVVYISEKKIVLAHKIWVYYQPVRLGRTYRTGSVGQKIAQYLFFIASAWPRRRDVTLTDVDKEWCDKVIAPTCHVFDNVNRSRHMRVMRDILFVTEPFIRER